MLASERGVPCDMCSQQKAIYTCPRCTMRTCSLTCSKSHKTLQSCSGERDKTIYVPMNRYTWGTMANDYAYLEEVGRKTTEWGREIVKGRYLSNIGLSRGKTRSGKANKGGNKGKRDFLKMQLSTRDIDMEVMPLGMEKRALNQSTWDNKTKLPLMTIEFLLHPSKYNLASSTPNSAKPFSILTHRNKLACSITEILCRHLQIRDQKDTVPEWVKAICKHMKDEDYEQIYFLIAQPSDSPQRSSKVYHRLNPTRPLLDNLRHKTFVEFPTVEVWEERAFTGLIVEEDGRLAESLGEHPPKRRRLGSVKDDGAMKELIRAYNDHDNDKGDGGNILTILGTYKSDDDTDTDKSHTMLRDAYEGSELEDSMEESTLEEPTLEEIHEILGVADGGLPLQDNPNWPVEGDEGHVSDWEQSRNEPEGLARAREHD